MSRVQARLAIGFWLPGICQVTGCGVLFCERPGKEGSQFHSTGSVVGAETWEGGKPTTAPRGRAGAAALLGREFQGPPR